MANSSIVGSAKNKIIKEFIKDENIVKAIDASDVESPEGLIGTHIFNYNQNPNTIDTVATFITVQVHIPASFGMKSNTYVNPTIEICIMSHEKHMVVDNIPKITENRNDYISRLIDTKLNGNKDFGVGRLELLSNVEGAYQKNYVYRTIVFKGVDINNSLCEDVDEW